MIKSLIKVTSLEEEANKCLKNGDFANDSAYYLSGIKLLCFSCIVSHVDKALFRHFVIVSESQFGGLRPNAREVCINNGTTFVT